MARLAFTFAFTFILAFTSSGQKLEPCSKELMNAEVRGLRIGMTIEQVNEILPGTRWTKPDDNEHSIGDVRFKPPAFEGTGLVFLEAFKGKLFRLSVDYQNEKLKWTDTDFTAALSAAWKIPEKWHVDIRDAASSIKCDGRYVSTLLGGTLNIADSKAVAELQEMANTVQERKRKAFKP